MSRMVYYDHKGNEVDPTEAEPVPETNYDLLISKTPEKMADWLCKILTYCSNRHCCPDCPLFKCCHDQPTDNIEGWLKSPVEGKE